MLKRFFSIMIVICIILSFIPVYPVYAFTPDDYLGNLSWDKMTDTEKWALCFNFTVAQCKAVLTADAKSYIENMETLRNFKESHNPDNFVSEDGKNVTIPKEFVEIVKQCIDDYVKENEPYIIKPTHKYTEVPASNFNSATDYNKFRSYAYSHDLILFRNTYNNGGMYLGDLTEEYKNGGGFVFINGYHTFFYMLNSDWTRFDLPCSYYAMEKNENGVYSFIDPVDYVFPLSKNSFQGYQEGRTDFHLWDNSYGSRESVLITKDGGRIRIFKSKTEFMDYKAGQRKVYYTSNYYNYVPEDLTVAIDDLQKTIDDMQDVIDKLLEQITDNTSESEIEELLRQILEELRNQQGGGGGSGGGDVNVDIDLSTTNSWLAKIYAKISQIADDFKSFFIFEDSPGINAKYISSLLERMLAQLRETVEGTADTVHAKLQETLDEILNTLKSIRRWTIADTVIDAADAVADWADLVLGVLKDATSGASAIVASLSSGMGEATGLLKSKFPFCVPWDIFAIVSFLKAEPEAPHFKLPIVLERHGIESYIEIDMEPFQIVSDICRTILALLYAYGLLMLTPKVIDIGKDML